MYLKIKIHFLLSLINMRVRFWSEMCPEKINDPLL